MNRVISKYLVIGLLVFGGVIWLQHSKMVKLEKDRDRYEQNSSALLSEMKRMQLDSATMALDTHTLRLTVDEYRRFRAEDAEKIKQMGIRLKDLEAAARHEVSVDVPIDATVKDSIVLRDTLPVTVQHVEMMTPYIQLSGMIEHGRLQGRIYVPVTLRQAVWIEYKRYWIFWKKVKAVHQTVSSDNPYVEIKFSEYITIYK
jgi:hypothetical protein